MCSFILASLTELSRASIPMVSKKAFSPMEQFRESTLIQQRQFCTQMARLI